MARNRTPWRKQTPWLDKTSNDSSTANETNLQSLIYENHSLKVIDQLLLPHELEYVDVTNVEEAWSVIRKMQVRGAPLIAIVAALGLAVDVFHKLKSDSFKSLDEAKMFLLDSMQHLRTSRPTAVNLFRATDELSGLVEKMYDELKGENEEKASSSSSINAIVMGYVNAAEKMLADDVADNKAIGNYGAEKILQMSSTDDPSSNRKLNILTICNTGSLATAGYGTALGVVRRLQELNKLGTVFFCETRPYNQGARLTAFEVLHEKMNGTLICDSMAAYLMKTRKIDACVVGADRVASNGDTANKIGTYMLGILCDYHKIPFFVAAPTTTLDLKIESGAEIPVEERAGSEMTSMFDKKIAPDGTSCWNPAFDVCDSSLITGIVTEIGVACSETKGGMIDLRKFVSENNKSSNTHENDNNNDSIDDMLDQIVKLSHDFGGKEYCLGSGGNTSVKTKNKLYVKPSGMQLCELQKSDFVEVDRTLLRKVVDICPPSDEEVREKMVKDLIMESVIANDNNKNPSVEVSLHNLIDYKYIVHTHATAVNGLTSAHDYKIACADIFPNSLVIEYLDPGYSLARGTRARIESYVKENGQPPKVIFLGNHGLFVSSDSPDEIRSIYKNIMSELSKVYSDAEKFLNASIKQELVFDGNTMSEEEELKSTETQLQYIQDLFEKTNCAKFITKKSKTFKLCQGAVNPYFQLYCRNAFLWRVIDSEEKSPNSVMMQLALSDYLEQNNNTPPRIIVFPTGIYGIDGDSQANADLALEMYQDGALIQQLALTFGGVKFLPSDSKFCGC